MKKILFLLISLSIIISGGTVADFGGFAGYARYTDIAAYINGYPISSFNIDGSTAVYARDLADYGFDIGWDEEARVCTIERNDFNFAAPQNTVFRNGRRAGQIQAECEQTDITAIIGGRPAVCCIINGRTVVGFDSLAAFGDVEWLADKREIRLTVDGLPVTYDADVPEYPYVTELYAPDGRTLFVDNDEIAAYEAVGWYSDISKVQRTLYAPDGRTITVFAGEAAAYEAVGWYSDISMVTRTLYSADGRTMTAFLDEIPLYLGLGWFKSPPGAKMVALTFDDGPSRYTGKILDALEKNGAKATFFVLGSRAASYADTLRRQAALGMEIGNHSYSHQQLTKLSAGEILSEKTRTDEAVRSVTGQNTTLFRPPYGSSNQTVANTYNLPVILWSIDTLDWKTRNAQSTVDTVMAKVKDGDIILMHDIYEASADAAVQLIPRLIAEGYQLVTVSELGRAKAGGLACGQVYHSIK